MYSKFSLFFNLIEDMNDDQIRNYLYNNKLSENEMQMIVTRFREYKSSEETVDYIIKVFPVEYRDKALFTYLNCNDSSKSCIEYIFKNIYKLNWKMLSNLCDLILENGHVVLIYNLAIFIDNILIKDEQIEKLLRDLENALINFNDKKIMVLFAKNIKNANIEKIQDAIVQNIDTKNISDAKAINEFKNIEKDGVDFKKLEEGIIKTKNNLEIMEFAMDPRADVNKLEKSVLEDGNISHIRLFAGLYNANIKMIDDYYMESQKNGSLNKYAYEFWLESNEKKGYDVLYNIIKKYFDYEIVSIKEGMDIVYNNLFKIIDEIGLIHFYKELRSLELNNQIYFKRNIFNYLLKIYPEKQEILQVYYSFLTSQERDLTTFNLYSSCDEEYKQLISSNEKGKVKKLD